MPDQPDTAEARRLTIAAYEQDATAYSEATESLPDSVARQLASYAERLGAGAKVLEIGSGSGRDANALEASALVVRRTDITPGFVALQRAAGHDAEVLDPLTDDLGGPWDGIWANACLLHVARTDLGAVLRRLAEATRTGGTAYLSLKEGDGEAWSRHGHVASPRHFTYWREAPLVALLTGAGWEVESVGHVQGLREPWLEVLAVRR